MLVLILAFAAQAPEPEPVSLYAGTRIYDDAHAPIHIARPTVGFRAGDDVVVAGGIGWFIPYAEERKLADRVERHAMEGVELHLHAGRRFDVHETFKLLLLGGALGSSFDARNAVGRPSFPRGARAPQLQGQFESSSCSSVGASAEGVVAVEVVALDNVYVALGVNANVGAVHDRCRSIVDAQPETFDVTRLTYGGALEIYGGWTFAVAP